MFPIIAFTFCLTPDSFFRRSFGSALARLRRVYPSAGSKEIARDVSLLGANRSAMMSSVRRELPLASRIIDPSGSGPLAPSAKPPVSLRLKTAIGISLMVIFASLGNVMLGKGMKAVGGINSWAPGVLFYFFMRALASAPIWLGISLLMAFFVCYILVLSWADYSYIQPASSISYAVVSLLAAFLLHEVVKPLQWAGVAIICLGVFIVGRTSPRTTRRL
jgi:uncharacterized membrane protein